MKFISMQMVNTYNKSQCVKLKYYHNIIESTEYGRKWNIKYNECRCNQNAKGKLLQLKVFPLLIVCNGAAVRDTTTTTTTNISKSPGTVHSRNSPIL